MTAFRSSLLRNVAVAKGAVLTVGVVGALGAAGALGTGAVSAGESSTPDNAAQAQVPPDQGARRQTPAQVTTGQSNVEHARSSGS